MRRKGAVMSDTGPKVNKAWVCAGSCVTNIVASGFFFLYFSHIAVSLSVNVRVKFNLKIKNIHFLQNCCTMLIKTGKIQDSQQIVNTLGEIRTISFKNSTR